MAKLCTKPCRSAVLLLRALFDGVRIDSAPLRAERPHGHRAVPPLDREYPQVACAGGAPARLFRRALSQRPLAPLLWRGSVPGALARGDAERRAVGQGARALARCRA